MNFKIKSLLFLSFLIQTQLYSQSDLFIDTSFTAEQMLMDFFDSPNVSISNVSYSGDQAGLSYFEGANTDLGISAGILLSTGFGLSAIGPNNSETVSGGFFNSLSDQDLEFISNNLVFDVAILEFDISSTIDTLLFNYVFSSEEYPEFTCSEFNDVFGFFVSGEGFDGPFTNNAENIALIPGTSDFVAINQINSGEIGISGIPSLCTPPIGSLSNSQYYNDNASGIHLQADGFTVPLPAPFLLLPGEIYHVKLVIGDVTDNNFDSGVFIGIESLNGDTTLTPFAEIQTQVVDNTVSFENDSRYATSYFWDFGDGTTSTERHPGPHTYAEDGGYDVLLITQNFCCTDTTSFFVQIGETTSTTSNEINKPYKILSNPVNDYLNLNLDANLQGEIAMYNGSGTLLRSEKISETAKIDVRSFQSGVYYLHINLEGKIYLEKIIKF